MALNIGILVEAYLSVSEFICRQLIVKVQGAEHDGVLV